MGRANIKKWAACFIATIGSLLFLFTTASSASHPVQIDFPPICYDSAVIVQQDTPTVINFDCTDKWQNSEFRIQFVSGLENGGISGHPNPAKYEQITPWGRTLSAVYTPNAGFTGDDSLTFRANNLVYPCPPEGEFACPGHELVDLNSGEMTVWVNVLAPDRKINRLANSCGNGRTESLRAKLKKSRKRYRTLKQRYKRFRTLGKSAHSSKSRRKYRSKAKRERARYRKTKKRSNRLRKKVITCRRAGF